MATSLNFTSAGNYNVAPFTISGTPVSLIKGNFDSDQIPDLAVVYSDNSISLLYGNSDFNTTFSATLPLYGGIPTSVTAGNFSGDQILDLAVVFNDGYNNFLSLLPGNGDGTFHTAFNPPVFLAGTPISVTAGDFSGDQLLDLLVLNTDNSFSLFEGDGNGGLTPVSLSFTQPGTPVSVTAGDFNGDQLLDVAVLNSNNSVSVFLDDGDYNFDNNFTLTQSGSLTSVVTGDFDGDGKDDLAIANIDASTVSVLLGNGDGTFGTANDFNVEFAPVSITAEDFNGDGKDDIAVVNSSGDKVSVLLAELAPTVGSGELLSYNNDIFQIGGDEFTKVKIKIQIKGRSSKLVNELGIFNVDDDNGTIDGIAPGAAGYEEAAKARATSIFSVISNNPTGFSSDSLSRILEYDAGTQLRFFLKTSTSIVFSSTTTQQITSLGEGGFSIGWKDGSRGESLFDDLVIGIQTTDEDLPIGIGLQGKYQGEAIDLRDFGQDTLINGSFSIYREASYNNYVGFYKVTDADGGIDIDGNGTADILPGQAGYVQAAINSRVAGIGLSVGNQGAGNSQGSFTGGGIYVPFLIINSGIDALLDNNSGNDPTVYFTFLGANSDNTQHVRLLGDNTFGFEDLVSGGDADYNDFVVKINLTA